MSVDATLARARADRQTLMRETCRVERGTRGALDPATGRYTPTSTVVYNGRCDVKPLAAGADSAVVGERDVVLRRYDAALPFDTLGTIAVDDVLTVTASADPRLVGRPLTVVAVGLGGRRTAWHLVVEDRQ